MKQPKRRLGPIFLITLGVILLVVSLGYWRFTATLERPQAATLPPTLAGFPLVKAAYGEEAVAEIARLHGKGFPLVAGAMGMYGSHGQAMLWVARAPLRPIAARMVAAMQERIAVGTSPFIPVSTRQDGRRTVYELTGMGLRHFYFQSSAQVIWLAADPSVADRALKEALAFYP
jgi:hypothetical protein